MGAFDHIVGHERPIKVLGRALKTGRTAHAYLLWGPDGIGKELVALATAKLLLCKDEGALKNLTPCDNCPSCQKNDAGYHPDLHLLTPGEKKISVAEVRAFQESLYYQAFERGRKVAIIRDAFNMSREAANALLKTIEEPPKDTFILILAHHRSQLLDTLVSRCQPLRFDLLTDEAVEKLLGGRGVDPSEAKTLAALAGGSPGLALAQDLTLLTELDSEVGEISGKIGNLTPAMRLDLAERWSKDKDSLSVRLDCLERALLKRAGDDAALAALERLFVTRELIGRNVNLQLALDLLFGMAGDGDWEEIA